MKFVFMKALGGAIKVFSQDETGEVVATFSNDEKGAIGFALFKTGLSLQVGAELLNADNGEYVIGTVAQIAGVEH